MYRLATKQNVVSRVLDKDEPPKLRHSVKRSMIGLLSNSYALVAHLLTSCMLMHRASEPLYFSARLSVRLSVRHTGGSVKDG